MNACEIKDAESMQHIKEFLVKRNYKLKIFICEDQTAIIKRTKYDVQTNCLLGFSSELNTRTGFPILNEYEINSLQDIQSAYTKDNFSSRLASNAYVFLAQPLHKGAPSFCLRIFGSNNRFSYEDILRRWQYLKEKAAEEGIEIVGFSSNGDTRCLKAMRVKSEISVSTNKLSPYYPFFQVSNRFKITLFKLQNN